MTIVHIVLGIQKWLADALALPQTPRFIETIEYLFTEGHVWNLHGTYSAMTLCLALPHRVRCGNGGCQIDILLYLYII